MKTEIILILCLFSVAFKLKADFVTDFQAAQDLYIRHRFIQAAEAFAKIAGSEKKAARRDKALLYAGRSIACQKSKNFEQALKTVQQISSLQLRTFAEIEVLFYCRKYTDIISKFPQSDLDALGDDYTYLACYYRGHAYFKCKKYELAKKDLEQAVSLTGSDKETGMLAYYDLIQTELKMKNTQLAFEITKTVAIKMSGSKRFHAYQKCILLGAEILYGEKKYAEAKEFLDRYSDKNSKRTRGYSRFCLYALYGDIELELENPGQAKEWYSRAIAAGNYGEKTEQVKAKLKKLK